MLFYIVTPSLDALPWLTCCVRSVADQVGSGVQVHHHVQDGGSTDGSLSWLEEWRTAHEGVEGYRFTFASEPDAGAYDAINRAWANLPYEAEVTALLNSDEQYLPGALAAVADAFSRDSEPELVLTSFLILDEDHHYISHRRALAPSLWSSAVQCGIETCTSFFRAESVRRRGLRFNSRWKCLADLFFARRLLAFSPRIELLPRLLTSTFLVTGHNLSWGPRSREERRRYMTTLSPWLVKCEPLIRGWLQFKHSILDRLLPSPGQYSVYLPRERTRSTLSVGHASPRSLRGLPSRSGRLHRGSTRP